MFELTILLMEEVLIPRNLGLFPWHLMTQVTSLEQTATTAAALPQQTGP